MSNYRAVTYDNANEELRAVYDDVKASMGGRELPNWITYMGEVPHVLKGSWSLLKSILVEGNLSPLLQDLIMFTVAYHRTVPYCMALHGTNLIRMTNNLTFDDLEQIARGDSRGYIPHKYALATEIASKLATTDCALAEADFQRLLQAGFNRTQVIEITMLVSVSLFFNTYTFAANMPVDPELSTPADKLEFS